MYAVAEGFENSQEEADSPDRAQAMGTEKNFGGY
jgi:hypothetical protein